MSQLNKVQKVMRWCRMIVLKFNCLISEIVLRKIYLLGEFNFNTCLLTKVLH